MVQNQIEHMYFHLLSSHSKHLIIQIDRVFRAVNLFHLFEEYSVHLNSPSSKNELATQVSNKEMNGN
jgi:hypothetical protein